MFLTMFIVSYIERIDKSRKYTNGHHTDEWTVRLERTVSMPAGH